MFIGVSMQLQAVFKYFLSHTVGRLPLKKKKKKERKEGPDVSSILSASCEQVKAGVCKEGEPVWGLSPELLCWGAWLLVFPWTNTFE